VFNFQDFGDRIFNFNLVMRELSREKQGWVGRKEENSKAEREFFRSFSTPLSIRF
jgi:hypothetical protein